MSFPPKTSFRASNSGAHALYRSSKISCWIFGYYCGTLREFHRIEMSLCCLGDYATYLSPPTRPENWQDNVLWESSIERIFLFGGKFLDSLEKQLKGPNNNISFMWPDRQNYMVKLLLGLYMMSGKFRCVFVMAPTGEFQEFC